MPAAERRKATDLLNAQDRPFVPNGERVAVKSVWGVEFYSSTQTEHLIGRLRSLGWERDANGFGPPPFSDWLYRSRHRRGSWRTIGELVTNPQERDTKVFPTALPTGVRNGHAFLATLTPSLKALCVHFIFDEESGQRFQKAMKGRKYTRSYKTRAGWRHSGPIDQRYHDVLAARRDLVKLVSGWFAEHAPGIFCGGQLGGLGPPTCEMLTFLNTEPVPTRSTPDEVAHECLCMLGVRWGSTAWVAQDPDVKFNLSHEVFINPRTHNVLTCREGTMKGDSPFADPHAVPRILSAVGAMHLVIGHAEMSNRLRDAVVSHARRSRVTRALKSLTTTDSAQLAPVLEELSAGHQGPLFGRSLELDPHPNNHEKVKLDELINGLVPQLAKSQRVASRQRMDELSQLCSLILQMRIGRLTVVLVVLTVVVAVEPVREGLTWALEHIGNLLARGDG